MKIAILNDCSSYHCGSAEVINLLKLLIKNNNHQITKIVPRHMLQFNISQNSGFLLKLIDDSDIIIVNGEGAFHNDNIIIDNLNKFIKKAKELNKQTILFNSVWQNNKKFKNHLENYDKIFVREQLSFRELIKDGYKGYILPDITFLTNNINKTKEKEIGFGADIMNNSIKEFIFKKCDGLDIVNIFNYNKLGFDKFVNSLAKYKYFISGRHHTFIACCKGGVKCIPIMGNSHKLKGILLDAKVNIPVVESIDDFDEIFNNTINGNLDEEYNKLFNYVNSFKIEDYNKIFE